MADRTLSKETTMRTLFVSAAVACLMAIAGALGFGAAPARAVEIRGFVAGPSNAQAGGHPDLGISYAGETASEPDLGLNCQCNEPKTVDVDTPAGFIGNPHATPQCHAADFARDVCPADSQVGVISISVKFLGFYLTLPSEAVYNSVPTPAQAGLLSFKLLPGFFGLPFYTVLEARTGGDYGLSANTELTHFAEPQSFNLTLWGVPADPSHDALRIFSNENFSTPTPSNSPRIPFLQNPTTCSAALSSTVTVTGYDGSVTSASSPWPTTVGCDQLNFEPSISAKPTTTAADSASGVDIDLTVPQVLSPIFPSPSELRGATLALPPGFSINPNAADGKTSCSDVAANIGTGSNAAANCPEFSKIGTDTVNSSALPQPIPGSIYLGDPQPGNRYRIFLTADGFNTHIKLAGSVHPDPVTGQVITTFENLPQSPLTEFSMHFFGAERGLLATPTQCGTYPVVSTFTPWDEALPNQTSTQFFTIDAGPDWAPCPDATRPFSPAFEASSVGNAAGAHSPFSIDLTRGDGDQNLAGLTVSTPPGFAGTLAGIPYCPDAMLSAVASSSYSGLAEQLSPGCPAASQVGTAITGAGAGSHPIYVPGKVYLAGPYKGAPLSLAIIIPAVSGPYDLGNVVVRTALQVDPRDAHVTAISGPLPSILDGIPLRLREIRVSLDRPGFTLNPTNCDPLSVKAAVSGDQGGESDLASHFQVANCADLPFAPKLSLTFSGGIRRRGHPAIHGDLSANPGEANPKRISVTLPKGELLDNSHIGSVCTRVEFARNACPAASRMGQATIITPLLDKPLSGAVYLRSSSHELPDLALDLEGQVDLEIAARIDSVNGRLRATFETVPDVPFSHASLDLAGGAKGLVQNSGTLCGQNLRATATMVGYNDGTQTTRPKLQYSCGSKGRRGRHQHRAGAER
jgi:hypothetical protein